MTCRIEMAPWERGVAEMQEKCARGCAWLRRNRDRRVRRRWRLCQRGPAMRRYFRLQSFIDEQSAARCDLGGAMTIGHEAEVTDSMKAVGQCAVSYTHLRAHETPEHLVCRLLLEKKKKNTHNLHIYNIL